MKSREKYFFFFFFFFLKVIEHFLIENVNTYYVLHTTVTGTHFDLWYLEFECSLAERMQRNIYGRRIQWCQHVTVITREALNHPL